MKHFPVLLLVTCGFVLATEFLGGSGLLAVLLSLACLHGMFTNGWRANPKAIAFSHVAFGLAYAVIHAALRCGRPMAYPPLVILGGLWCAALMVIAAAITTAAFARRRRS